MPEDAKTPEIGSRLGHRVSIKKLQNKDGQWTHPVYRWRASYIENGKRRLKGFKTQKAAQEWAEQRESENLEHGTGAALTAAERSAVIDNRQELLQADIDLREAISFTLEAHRRLSPLSITREAALAHAVDYFTRASKSATVSEVIASLIQTKLRTGKSERYLGDLRNRLGRFKADFGGRAIATIETVEINDWLAGLDLGPLTSNNYRRLLVVLFNHARKSKFVTENPASESEKFEEVETEIGILSVAEIAALLENAPDEIRAAIALGGFAGLRSSEIHALDWSEVDLAKGFIRVRPVIAKSARNRLIPISSNLKAWLAPLARKAGQVYPPDGRKKMDTARIAAGFRPSTIRAGHRDLKPWPSNALRHSYGSYHLAHHQDASALALNMGHESPALIFRHYREVVTPEQAAAYWNIWPETADNIVNIKESA